MPTVAWTYVEDDGEYQEQWAQIDTLRVTIFSDHDGELWSCRIDSGDEFTLDATDERSARRAAEHEAALWLS